MNYKTVKDLLIYNPETGDFTWRYTLTGHIKEGRRPGHIDKKGYLIICLDYFKYPAHRVAWLYYYGEWPKLDIDHIDGDKRNNKISNLRLATRGQNLLNRGARCDSITGVRGVSPARYGKYQARLNGRYLGRFNTIEEAAAVYAAEARKEHGEFYHGHSYIKA